MVKQKLDVKSESKATSWKSKKGLGFSWNLNWGAIMLEDSVPFNFNVSCDSLEEIKNKAKDGIAEILLDRTLLDATEDQIKKNKAEMSLYNEKIKKRYI